MEDQDAEQLRFTLGTTGWTQVLKPMLEARLANAYRALVVNPEQRTAGRIEELTYLLASPAQTLAAHDEEALVKPQPEAAGVGDPYSP